MTTKKPNPIPGNKPFKKGQSGNPKGRPKLPDLKEALAKVLGDEKEGKTAVEAILMALRKKAVAGDTKAAQILLDRGYGGSIQKVMNTDSDGEPLPTIILQGVKPKK